MEVDGGRERDWVAVGVDGSAPARAAALWAAQEAHLRRTGLIIANVSDAEPAESSSGRTLASERLLETSVAVALEHEPGLLVATRLLQGRVSVELVRLSGSAALLVVGVDQRKPRAAHGAMGAIEDRIAAQARCPVVTVGHPSAPAARSQAQVVAAVGSPDDSALVLNAAAAEAQLRGARLIVFAEHPTDRRADGARLAEAVAGVAERFPRLKVGVGDPSPDLDGILAAAEGADLLVVAAHHADDPWSIRTGPLAATAMRRTSCPVMLVGPTSSTRGGTVPERGVNPLASS